MQSYTIQKLCGSDIYHHQVRHNFQGMFANIYVNKLTSGKMSQSIYGAHSAYTLLLYDLDIVQSWDS